MRALPLLVLSLLPLAGCAAPVRRPDPAAEALDFRVENSVAHAQHATPQLHDRVADDDVEIEMAIGPHDKSMLTVQITNKTAVPLAVRWDESTLNRCTCFRGCPTGIRLSGEPARLLVAPGERATAQVSLPYDLKPEMISGPLLVVPMLFGDERKRKDYSLDLTTRAQREDQARGISESEEADLPRR
jgi:hypothetical protein